MSNIFFSNKIACVYFMLFTFSQFAFSQTTTLSTDENHIHTVAPQVETTDGEHKRGTTTDLTVDEKIESVTYFDGLGRAKQSIGIRAGGNKEDIITHIEYDAYGRQVKDFLPYANNTIVNGEFVPTALNDLQSFYNTSKYENTTNPYSEKNLEASPLSRVLEQGAPGADWALDKTADTDHTIKFEYATNTEADYVKLYEVSFLNGNTENPQLVDAGEYDPGALYKTITKDENWTAADGVDKTTEEYKNKQGQVILKRTYNNTKWHDTYYVYDDYGNLTYVLPPKLNTYFLKSQQNWIEKMGSSDYDDLITNMFVNGAYYPSIYLNYNSNTNMIDLSIDAWSDYDIGVNSLELVDGFIYKIGLTAISNVFLGDIYFYSGTKAGSVSLLNGDLHFTSTGASGEEFNTFQTTINLSGYSNLQPIDDHQLNDLAYQYKYDSKNRLIEKKIPGKGWEYIVYDDLDRPVLTQDANHDNNYWLFTKYDVFGRVIYTGDLNGASSRASAQNDLNNSSSLPYEERIGSPASSSYPIYYSLNNAYPEEQNLLYNNIYTINYYDNYNNVLPTGFTPPTTVLEQNVSTQTNGLPTVSKVRVLDVSPAKWITTVTYYDDKARPIYVYSYNEYLETTDIIETKYDFVNVIETKTTHKKTGKSDIVTYDYYEYDHTGRLLSQTQSINNQNVNNRELIVLNTYDELGQLESKKVGGDVASNLDNSTGLQTIDYTYNIRGWLKNINNPSNLGNDLFSFGINYNTPSHPTSYHNKPLYNGNISHTYWKTNNESDELREYAYSYDDLNRFTNAYYAENSTNNSNYNSYIYDYDKNGNIGRLRRYMENPTNPNYSTGMDNLTYTYDSGNKLIAVKDSYGLSATGAEGFKDGNTSGNDYYYDTNGNMVRDLNKGIGTTTLDGITYNHLNLPDEVKFENNNNKKIKYIYDATGVKLRKLVYNNSPTPTTTDYAGNYVYEGSSLKFFNHPEGYVDAENGYKYVYQYKDHLGNVRLSYKDNNGTLEILEENNYYPFGLKHKGYNNGGTAFANPALDYQYNGVEYEDALGLNLYEMDVRMYDPAIARFNGIDPVTHHWQGTSVAFANNPIYYADPSGASEVTFKSGDSFFAETWDSLVRASKFWPEDKDEEDEDEDEQPKNIFTNFLNGVKRFFGFDFNSHERAEEAYSSGDMDAFEKAINEVSENSRNFERSVETLTGLAEILSSIEPTGISGIYYEYALGNSNTDKALSIVAIIPFSKLAKGAKIINFAQKGQKVYAILPDGFRVVNRQYSRGQKVYTNGKIFISPDVDGHNGGLWKAATSVYDLGKKNTRLGTYDVIFQRIGD